MRLLFKFRGEEKESLSVQFLKFGLWSLSHPAGCHGEGRRSLGNSPQGRRRTWGEEFFLPCFPLSLTDLFFSHKVVKS